MRKTQVYAVTLVTRTTVTVKATSERQARKYIEGALGDEDFPDADAVLDWQYDEMEVAGDAEDTHADYDATVKEN